MKRMYHKTLTTLLTVLCTAIATAGFGQGAEIKDDCTAPETRQKCKTSLSPFKYDAGKIVRITFKKQEQQKEYEIPLYMGEKYRFVFNKEGLPQDVTINVYNKKIGSKKRELLFTTDGKPFDDQTIIWEPEKSRKMYVNFEIPATEGEIKKGCVVFLLGYQL